MKLITLILVLASFISLFFIRQSNQPVPPAPTPSAIRVIASNIRIPWGLALLPDNSLILTERTGAVKRIDESSLTIHTVADVAPTGEGGLLGLALDPDFTANSYIYLYVTYRNNGQLYNRVERYSFINDALINKSIILDGINGSSNHDGGRIAFGPDRLLYITTGDAETPSLAQDTNSLNGKILRINADGTIPPDNPFNNAVYSYGHRNPQGLAWDDQHNLWSTEHGPSGIESGYDELNLIFKGGNYGWPDVYGPQSKTGTISPVKQSGADETWAPAGLAYINGSLFFPGLRGQTLYEARLNGTTVTQFNRHLVKTYGRLRTVIAGRNQDLYLTTSNTDGRGDATTSDDLILYLPVELLN